MAHGMIVSTQHDWVYMDGTRWRLPATSWFINIETPVDYILILSTIDIFTINPSGLLVINQR